jgi:hypothetical protein
MAWGWGGIPLKPGTLWVLPRPWEPSLHAWLLHPCVTAHADLVFRLPNSAANRETQDSGVTIGYVWHSRQQERKRLGERHPLACFPGVVKGVF